MNQHTTLRVPALRAKMGDWIYYSAFMQMADIAERVSLADDIHRHKELRDLIQRQVDDLGHAEAIKTYLLTQESKRPVLAVCTWCCSAAMMCGWLMLR